MKLYIIAGEASGDLHGSNLIRAIRNHEPACDIRCWGGDLMEMAGGTLVRHYRDLAFMGFLEVVMNLRTILRNIDFCKNDIAEWKPDALVLVDYPGFNLRIARWAKENHIPVYYYISPQIWAWKEKRVESIRRDVTRMYVVLPFEKDFYAKHEVEVDFVGHPLLDAIASETKSTDPYPGKEVIALLPGSRKQEIRTILPLMLEAVSHFPHYQFIIAGAPSQPDSLYREILGDLKDQVPIWSGRTYELLKIARAGLVTSGTATLEAGLFGMPQVVCYKGSAVSYFIARKLVNIRYISLVNLILDREAVTELIQSELNARRIVEELSALVNDPQRTNRVKKDYESLRIALGGHGASERTANLMLKSLRELLKAKL